MRTTLLCVTALAAWPAAAAEPGPAARPNVVLIYADDMYEIPPGETLRLPWSL